MTEEQFPAGYIEEHFTGYVFDANMSEPRRSECRRILALECAMSLPGNTVRVVLKNARDIETYLRGVELKAVGD